MKLSVAKTIRVGTKEVTYFAEGETNSGPQYVMSSTADLYTEEAELLRILFGSLPRCAATE